MLFFLELLSVCFNTNNTLNFCAVKQGNLMKEFCQI